MAYVAVISLIQTLKQLKQRKPHWITGETGKMVEFLLESLEYFQYFLENSSKIRRHCGKVEELEREIRAAVNEAEDAIELQVYDIYNDTTLQTSEALLSKTFLRTLVEKINAFKRRVMRRKISCKTLLPFVEKIDALKRNVLASSFDTNEDQGYGDPTSEGLQRGRSVPGHSISRYFAKLNPENIVVGLEDHLMRIIRRLKGPKLTREIVPILGMGGIGKTTLAKKVYDDPEIRHHFDIHIWVTIYQEYRIRDLLLGVLSCITQQTNESKEERDDQFMDMIYKKEERSEQLLDMIYKKEERDYQLMVMTQKKEESDDQLMDMIYKKLKYKRYLVVIDDIWSYYVWDLMSRIFPDDNNGSRILLTSRLKTVALHADPESPPHEMTLLNVDDSWKLLHDKVFVVQQQVCPPELEDIGKKVAKRCQGLPLTLLVVAGHLSKIARTAESWEDVAKSVSKVVASADNCLGVLAMSYNYLPNHLKPCLLYMGVFPEDCEVNIGTLINLWITEGFIRRESLKSLEQVGRGYLEDLISRNLVMVRKRRLNGDMRTCGVHDLVRDLILRETEKEKFLQVTTDPSGRKLHPRRTSCHSYITYDADCWESSSSCDLFRTVLFFRGLDVPLLACFKLLRVLAVLDFRFPYFPLEITKLVHLRYLELYCDDDLHKYVAELYNLQTLIFHRKIDEPTTVPAAIWQVKHLRHLQVSDFFTFQIPSGETLEAGFKLENLERLSALCLTNCTPELISAVPNLKRLKIQADYRECDRDKIPKLLYNLSSLAKLEILKFRGYGLFKLINHALPISLKRLTLYNTYLPWEDMTNIAMLRNLQVLKIKHGGFHGDVWRLNEDDIFDELKFLLIECTDLKHWEACSNNFPNLQRLVLRKCFFLEEIPLDLGEICTLESIELHSCSTSSATSAIEIQEDQESMGNSCLCVVVHKCRD